MSRSVLFDTETTGLDPLAGDRIIEIAALELVRDLPTGVTFHRLIDPERDIDPEATRVHGLTRSDLAGKPRFAEIVDELLAFIGEGPLVAHNAPFDFGFLAAARLVAGGGAVGGVAGDDVSGQQCAGAAGGGAECCRVGGACGVCGADQGAGLAGRVGLPLLFGVCASHIFPHPAMSALAGGA